MCWLLLYFLIGNPTQNAYNGKFSSANNEVNVANVRKKNYYGIS